MDCPKSSSSSRLRRFYNDKAGVTIVILTTFIVALFAFAALSLDVGLTLKEQRKAQFATDAGAFAGVVMLTNSTQNVSAAIERATLVAASNGVTAAEIAAGARGGFPGEVQVGIWTSAGVFLPNQTTNGVYNAVRVPARRTVPMNFAKVVGITEMTPAVDSVAKLEYLSAVYGLRPFTISSNLLSNVAVGQSFTVVENDVGSLNSGQWGQLDYQNSLQGSAWYQAMIDGYQGLIPTGNNWAELNQGNDHVRQAFEYLIDNHITIAIPVIDTFVGVPNNGNVNIVGFIGLEVTGYQNRGRNSEITFTLRQALASGTGGGPPGTYGVVGRFMVK